MWSSGSAGIFTFVVRAVRKASPNTPMSGAARAWPSSQLKAQGQTVGRHRVARLMRREGLRARRRRKFVRTTNSKHGLPVAPNVLARDFNPPAPDRAWATDITYVPTREGWLYLSVVQDLFSRRVIGWAMDHCIDRHLVLSALDMALKGRRPPAGLVPHSDRGSQYACADYQRALAARGIRCNMSRKGNCCDNAVVESFFSTLKTELVHERTSLRVSPRRLPCSSSSRCSTTASGGTPRLATSALSSSRRPPHRCRWLLNPPVHKTRASASSRQHLWVDRGYDYDEVRRLAKEFCFTLHVPRRGKGVRTKTSHARQKARRWSAGTPG